MIWATHPYWIPVRPHLVAQKSIGTSDPAICGMSPYPATWEVDHDVDRLTDEISFCPNCRKNQKK